MPLSNKYVYHSRISEAIFRQLIKLFCLDLTATQIAEITGLSRNSVNKYLKAIHQRIATFCEAESPFCDQAVGYRNVGVLKARRNR